MVSDGLVSEKLGLMLDFVMKRVWELLQWSKVGPSGPYRAELHVQGLIENWLPTLLLLLFHNKEYYLMFLQEGSSSKWDDIVFIPPDFDISTNISQSEWSSSLCQSSWKIVVNFSSMFVGASYYQFCGRSFFFFKGRELFSPDLKDLATIHVNDGVNSMAFFLVEFDGIISKLFLCAYCLWFTTVATFSKLLNELLSKGLGVKSKVEICNIHLLDRKLTTDPLRLRN